MLGRRTEGKAGYKVAFRLDSVRKDDWHKLGFSTSTSTFYVVVLHSAAGYRRSCLASSPTHFIGSSYIDSDYPQSSIMLTISSRLEGPQTGDCQQLMSSMTATCNLLGSNSLLRSRNCQPQAWCSSYLPRFGVPDTESFRLGN